MAADLEFVNDMIDPELLTETGLPRVEFDSDGVVLRLKESDLQAYELSNSDIRSPQGLLSIIAHLCEKHWVTTAMIGALIDGAQERFDYSLYKRG